MKAIRFLILAAAGLLLMCGGSGFAEQPPKLKIAFVHAGAIGMQGWTYQHDQARQALEHYFGERIAVTTIEKLEPGADAERLIISLARDGNRLIFVTSPLLTDA